MRSAFDAAASVAARQARQPDPTAAFPLAPHRFQQRLRDPGVQKQVRAYRNTVFKALRWRHNQIAKLNRNVSLVTFETAEGGRRKVIRTPQESHPVTRIFAKGARGQPNPWVTSGNFIATMEIDVGLTGVHFSLKVREEEGDARGGVRWLLRIRPDWVQIIPDEKNVGIDGYLVSPPGSKPFKLMASEVLHVKTPSPMDDRIGWSPLRSLNYSVDTGDEIRRFNWQFFKQGARVLYDKVASVHVHGHASQEELKLLLSLVKPKFFMPIHGEYRHLNLHARLAESVGISEDRIFLMEDGDILEVNPQSGKKIGKVTSSNVYVDGLSVGDINGVVLRDRRMLSKDGIVMVVIAINRQTGKLVGRPDIMSRGFVDATESRDMIEESRDLVFKALNHSGDRPADWGFTNTKVRDTLNKFYYEHTRRRPMVLPFMVKV